MGLLGDRERSERIARRVRTLEQEGVDRLVRQAQKIARKQEAGHLAPAVGQQLVDLDRPGGHIEHVIGGLALVEQGIAGREFHGRDDGRHPRQLLLVERAADRQVARRLTSFKVSARQADKPYVFPSHSLPMWSPTPRLTGPGGAPIHEKIYGF